MTNEEYDALIANLQLRLTNDVNRDYHDDISDLEFKQSTRWNNELQNNPMYENYI